MARFVVLLPVVIAFLVGAVPALAWTWPVDGPVLQQFSIGEDPYEGGQHRGIDIGGPVSDPVRAPAGRSVSSPAGCQVAARHSRFERPTATRSPFSKLSEP